MSLIAPSIASCSVAVSVSEDWALSDDMTRSRVSSKDGDDVTRN